MSRGVNQRMVHSGMALDSDSQARGGWTDDNDRGLSLAAAGDWADAAVAFQAAVDALTADEPLRPATHEPLALVLGNLSHACFKAGQLDAAIQHAQRTCALRAAITGEDGMPVARARMDLAVMLASSGRGDEAMLLIQRAIAAIEHRVGDEDVRLAVVLENAARIALALGSPSNAEPLLLRLHALLHAHELSTGRADKLLAKVADVRDRQLAVARTKTPRAGTPTSVEVLQRVAETIERRRLVLDDLEPLEESVPDPILDPTIDPTLESLDEVREYAHASIETRAPWEEEPVMERPPIAEPVAARNASSSASAGSSAAAMSAAATSAANAFRDLDRGPTIAMPTPDRGVRTLETPARGTRVPAREDASARRESESAPARKSRANASPSVTETPTSGSMVPMFAGIGAAVAAGAGAVWWFVLR